MKNRTFGFFLTVCLVVGWLTIDVSAGEVEVLHWWMSGGEAKSVAVLKDQLEKEGHTWKDMAVAGGAGDNAMTVLKSRAVAGNPPTAAQVKGPQIQQWGDEGLLTNLDSVARRGKWNRLLPKVVADVMKYKGHYVAVPVNVHRINWMWCNPRVFLKAGAEIPTTWKEFETSAKQLKRSGFVPVAWGGQNWQEATVFESIVLGVGGADFYRKALVEADPKALNSATMIKVFETLRMVLKYIDKGAPGRDWNLATAMVIKGEAGMQFMGDWAKGEFTAAGKKVGSDFVAYPVPESSQGYLFNVDSFIMFKKKDRGARAAQRAMARLIMEPKFQEVFNVNKGSIPSRLGMSRLPFDHIAHASMDAFSASAASGGLQPSMAHEMAVFPAIRGAIFDVVTSFCNSKTSAEKAAERLANDVQAVR
ncbi:MAG: carbohydrate ABC transporter substrate-binding protein [Proteobacteria bacterium]|nr:carbohydrate ABC transporter substrate-binding protein [Pseudomonadota bacterium]